MTRKKILWLCSWYPNRLEPFNGDFIERHAFAAASVNDIHVIHVAGDEDLQEEFENLHQAPLQGLTEHIVYYKKAKSGLARIRNYYRWQQAYKKAIGKYIQKKGNPDVVHVHIPYRAGIVANDLRRRLHIPYVVTEHWTIYQPGSPVKYKEQGHWFRTAMKMIIRNSSKLLPVSQNLGEMINSQVAAKNFEVIENTADVRCFFYDEQKSGSNTFRFVHVSNMTYQKNVEAIVECFIAFQKDHPETELYLVGQVAESVRQLVVSSDLLDRKIFFVGEISYEAVAIQLQQANALLMFSRFENSPCSIIEALCCGLPVIATNVGGVSELVNSDNGMLIKENDKPALIKAMQDLVSGYGNFNRQAIADAAGARFNFNVIGKKLDDVYNRVMDTKN